MRKKQPLANHLKDPENYTKIQEHLLRILKRTGHSHAEIIDYQKCFPCQKAYEDWRKEKKKLGFISPGQFMDWEKQGNLNFQREKGHAPFVQDIWKPNG